jgi:hypothetical protein
MAKLAPGEPAFANPILKIAGEPRILLGFSLFPSCVHQEPEYFILASEDLNPTLPLSVTEGTDPLQLVGEDHFPDDFFRPALEECIGEIGSGRPVLTVG